tara:strand:+ start:348 stop:623 length:276 start_codon:yes stop_codon:yes gene_type:complete
MPHPKVKISDNSGNEVSVTSNKLDVNASGSIITSNSLVPSAYDYIILTYNSDGAVATATYKTGGASGTTVAVLTLGYDADKNLSTVTKTNS